MLCCLRACQRSVVQLGLTRIDSCFVGGFFIGDRGDRTKLCACGGGREGHALGLDGL